MKKMFGAIFLCVLSFVVLAEQENFNLRHPERQSGEVFVTNAHKDRGVDAVDWQTGRQGKVAYNAAGARVNDSVPIFARIKEICVSSPDAVRRLLPNEEYSPGLCDAYALTAVTQTTHLPDFNLSHPERQPGEVFILNTNKARGVHAVGWASRRQGNVAYTSTGEPIRRSVPIFASIKEICQVSPDILQRLMPEGEYHSGICSLP